MEKRVVNRKQAQHRKARDEEFTRKKRISSIKLLVSQNKLSRALSEIQRFLEDYPDNSYGLFQEANIMYLLGDIEKAKEKFQYIVDNQLESQYASLYKLGEISYMNEDFDSAYKYFIRNIETSPYKEKYSIIGVSRIFLETGEYDKAIEVLHKYSDMNDLDVLIQKANALRKIHKYKEAYEILMNNNFDENEDTLRDYYIIKGIVETELSMFEEAEKSLLTALSYSKNKYENKVKTELAYTYYLSDQLDKALELAQDVMDSADNKYHGKAIIILGQIYMKKYEYEKAYDYFVKSLEYNYYRDPRGYLYISEVFMIQRDYENAQKYIDEFLRNSKNYVYNNLSHLRTAVIGVKTNDLEKVIENISKVNNKYLEGKNVEDYEAVNTYIKWKTGKKINYSIYSVSQLANYSIDRLIEHIDKEHVINDLKASFDKDINLEELVSQMPELLDDAMLISNRYYEKYRLRYDNIGEVNGKKVNTLHVVTLPNSKKIITMYPVYDDEKQNVKEIKSKVKQKSQIDKFNQKYRKMNGN